MMISSGASLGGDAGEAERVLLITKHAFVPAADGTAAIIALWYECLAELGFGIDVLSFEYVREGWSDEGRARLARDGTGLHLVPAYGRRAARGRLLTLAHAAVRGHRFAPEWLRTDRDARARLDAIFRRPYVLIAVHGVDAAHLAGPARLRAHPAPTVLDIHDHVPDRTLALQRTLRRLGRSDGLRVLAHLPRSDTLQAIAWPSRRRLERAERRVALGCDRILCSAASERDALRASGVPADRLVAVRWPVALPPKPTGDDASPRRQAAFDFGFLASAAPFNTEGLLWFCRHVWPAIRAARPDATCLLAGRVGDALRTGLDASRPGITVAGWIDDLACFYRDVRVVVVPLLSGTGVSVKTMEAAAHGAAIVATTPGLRGLALADGLHVRRADTASAFADACVGLGSDGAEAHRLGAAARAAIATAHAPADFTRHLRRLVATLLNEQCPLAGDSHRGSLPEDARPERARSFDLYDVFAAGTGRPAPSRLG